MKRTTLLLAAAIVSAAFAAPALAQDKCTDEFKAATYSKFYDNRKEHQDVAYAAAKEYLATCTTDDQYTAALKKFVKAFDDLQANTKTGSQFEEAVKNKNYADQIRFGKDVLTTAPDNTVVYIVMGLAGFNDPNLLNESTPYAKKAIEMLEGGKPFAPYQTKDQALAYLNWTVAKSTLKTAPTDAIPMLLKAARYESDVKKTWQLYYDLATAYNEGPRAKLTNDYKPFVGQTETPESKLILANLNQVIDRQIDALARGAALADAANKKAIMEELTDLYKYRNKSEAGLNELVASVLSKPIPDVPTPLTSLPATPSTSASPATSGGATGAQTTTQNKTGSGTVSGSTGAKPVASPTPSNKKPRSNHRRG